MFVLYVLNQHNTSVFGAALLVAPLCSHHGHCVVFVVAPAPVELMAQGIGDLVYTHDNTV